MPVSKNDVAIRAYQIWDSEGRPEGRDRDHWLRAESELAVAASSKVVAEDPQSQAPSTRRRRLRER
jgi:Protein of unknown function (DUF2934)